MLINIRLTQRNTDNGLMGAFSDMASRGPVGWRGRDVYTEEGDGP